MQTKVAWILLKYFVENKFSSNSSKTEKICSNCIVKFLDFNLWCDDNVIMDVITDNMLEDECRIQRNNQSSSATLKGRITGHQIYITVLPRLVRPRTIKLTSVSGAH